MFDESDLAPYSCSELPAGPFLIFAPHPDDETFGMGGTIAAAAEAGIEVIVVFVTDGSCGGDPSVRKAEAEAACTLLGVKKTYFLSIPDRKVSEERKRLENALGKILAENSVATIFLTSPFEYHPDHRATSLIVWEFLKRKGWEGGVWFYEVSRQGEVNKLINIDAYIHKKIEAIRLYKSQVSLRNYEEVVLALNRSRTFTLENVNYAEGFFSISSAGSLNEYFERRKLYVANIKSTELESFKENPLVSVVVRTKDRPKFLKRALTSIADQTYRPLEVLVINDGGIGLPVEELKSILGDIRLEYISFEHNRGRAAAGNEGIRRASGKYITFLDDDDEYLPEHISMLVYCLENADFRGAYTGCRMVAKRFDPETKSWSDKKELLIFNQPFSYEFLLFENYIPLIAIMLEKEALIEIGGFDEGLEKFEDWDLLIRFSSKYPLYHIDAVTCQYNSWSDTLQILGQLANRSEQAYLKVLRKHFPRLNPEIIAKWQFHTRLLLEERFREVFQPIEKNFLKVEKEREDLREKVLDYEAEIVRIKRELNDYRSQHTQHVELINSLHNQLETLDSTIKELSRELEAVYNSVSWKLVSKLRKIGLYLMPPESRRRRLFEFLIKRSHKSIDTAKSISLERSIEVSKLDNKPLDPENFSVCFVVNHLDAGQRYRGYNMSEYLEYAGVRSKVFKDTEIRNNLVEIFSYDVIVLYRLFYSDYLADVVSKLKQLGKIVIYDIDDYIFDESALPYLNVRDVPKEELRRVIRNHRRAMDLCDYCIVSTDALARIMSGINKKAFVLRNGLSDELIKISREAFKYKSPATDIIKIGYFSGTATHDKDFLEASEAIVYVLEKYKNVQLIIGGHLKLDKRFDKFIDKGQIEFLPYVHWKHLPYNLVKAHINLVPLEQNIFNDAKSELKYFELALLQIPTIASPVESYRYAINPGINGFLAGTQEEWIECMEMLIENRNLLKEIGLNCYNHVMMTYTPQAMSTKVREVYREIIAEHLSLSGEIKIASNQT